MEVILREVGRAAVFCDERMAVAKFAAWLVKLEARAAGEPYRGDSLVVQGGGELVKAGNALAADGDKGIHGDKENAGSLAQAKLRNGRVILSESCQAPRWEKKTGKRILSVFQCARKLQPAHFSLYLVARL
jgi:hypothetical protein